MFSKRSGRRVQGGRSGRALGLTLLALALSGSALAAGTVPALAGARPPAGLAQGAGTPVGDPPTPPPATPSPTPGAGHVAPVETTPSQAPNSASSTAPGNTSPAAGGSGPVAETAPGGPTTGTASHMHPAGPPAPRAGSEALNLDGVRVPPVEAMTPVSGLNFRSGLELGPALLVADLLGLGLLAYVLRRRWRRSSA